MNGEQLRNYLEFYRDLGVKTLYRRNPSVEERVQEVPASAPPAIPALAPDNDTLLKIMEDIGDCHRCRLHEGRNKIVFGSGDEHSPVVFVGEGPGADEDEQGLPFVGRAGQLLTQMIEGTA